jgi:hypothetical protein
MATELVTLHTAEATFVHRSSPPMERPYQRLVGLSREVGFVACRDTTGRPIRQETLQLPSALATNLADFATEHLTDFDPEEPRLTVEQPPLRYQCYTFAQYMHGERPTGEEAKTIIGYLCATAPRASKRYGLDMGEHGALVSSRTGQILHSMIGLGDGRTIQAMDVHGNVGIAQQKDVNHYYDNLGYRPWLYLIGALPERMPQPTMA